MKLSELLADLNNRPQTAQVLVLEPDLLQSVGLIMIESVAREGNGKVVMLMGKSAMRRPVDEFFSRMVEDVERGKPTRVFKATVHESDKNDGEYSVSIDGQTMQDGFETIHEATLFARGFVLGFEMGASGKGHNAANLPGL
jgi:hypothetical protein